MLLACRLTLLAESPGPQPEVRQVRPPEGGCRGCRVAIGGVTELGRRDGLEVNPLLISATRARDGRVLVSGYGGVDGIAVFTQDGRFSGRLTGDDVLGVRFHRPRVVLNRPGSGILVLDVGSNTIVALNDDLVPVSVDTIRDVTALQMTATNHSTVVLAGLSEVHRTAGIPLHRFELDSKELHPMGRPVAVRPDRPASTWRLLSPGVGGGVWAARVNDYRLEYWDSVGERLRTLSATREWMVPWEDAGHPSDGPPQSSVIGLQTLGDSLVALYVAVPSRNAPRPGGRREPGPATEQSGPSFLEVLRWIDTQIEIVDVRSQTAVFSARMRGPVFPTDKYGEVLQVHRPIIGRPFLRMLSLEFRGRPQ